MANTATVEIIVSARDQTATAFKAVSTQLRSLEKQAQAVASGMSAPFRILGGVLGTLANIAGTVVRGAFSALKTAMGWVRDQIDNLIEGSKRAMVVFGGLAAAGTALITKITMYAARTEELGIALAQVAKVTGHSTGEIQAQEKAIKALGITSQAARTLLMRMFAAELDVSYATKIARAAQDLAVIGMRNSSEAATDLLYAITSLQPRLLRKYGIYVNLTDLWKKTAKNLGKVVAKTIDNTDAIRKLNLTIEENIVKYKQLAEKIAEAREEEDYSALTLERLEIDYRQLGLAIELGRTKLAELTEEHGLADTAAKGLEVSLTALEKRQAFTNAILEQAAAYAGTYEAAMTTAGKQIRSFRRYIEELMNQFGEFFLPVLAEGVRVATEFVKSLIALPAATKELISRFLLAAIATASVIAGLTGLVVLVSKLVPLIQFFLNPLGAMVGILAVLAARWLTTGDVMSKVSNFVQTVIIPAFMALRDKVVDFANKVIEKMRPAILWIQSWLYQLQVRLRHALSTGNWDPFLRLLSIVVREAWNKLKPLRGMLAGIVMDFITKAKDWLSATGMPILEKALGGIKDLITNTVWPNYVKPALSWLIERVGAWVEGTGFPFLQRTFESLWSWIKDSLWPWLKDEVWPWIKPKLEWLIAQMSVWVETTGGPLLAQLAKNLWAAFWRSAAESMEIPEWMTRLKEQIAAFWRDPKAEWAKEWAAFEAGAVPSFQYGGIVPGKLGTPQLIMAHAGERITPPSRAGLPLRPAPRPFVVEVPVYLDGREVAHIVSPHLGEEYRRERGLRI